MWGPRSAVSCAAVMPPAAVAFAARAATNASALSAPQTSGCAVCRYAHALAKRSTGSRTHGEAQVRGEQRRRLRGVLARRRRRERERPARRARRHAPDLVARRHRVGRSAPQATSGGLLGPSIASTALRIVEEPVLGTRAHWIFASRQRAPSPQLDMITYADAPRSSSSSAPARRRRSQGAGCLRMCLSGGAIRSRPRRAAPRRGRMPTRTGTRLAMGRHFAAAWAS